MSQIGKARFRGGEQRQKGKRQGTEEEGKAEEEETPLSRGAARGSRYAEYDPFRAHDEINENYEYDTSYAMAS